MMNGSADTPQNPNPPLTSAKLPNINSKSGEVGSNDFSYRQNTSPLKSRILSGDPDARKNSIKVDPNISSYHDFNPDSYTPTPSSSSPRAEEQPSSPAARKKRGGTTYRARSCSLEPRSLDEAKASLHNFHSRNEEFRQILSCLMKIGRGTNLYEAEQAIMQACCEILKSDRSDIYMFDS